MSETKRKVPKLRFPGFEGEWEQRKLDDIAQSKIGGGTPKTSNESFWNGDIPWIQSSDLTEGDIKNIRINKYISSEAVESSSAKIIDKGAITLVTRVGVGKLAVVDRDFTTSQDFLSLSGFDDCNVDFIAYQLYRLMQEKAKVLQGTSIKGITKNELLDQEILIPLDIKEQESINQVLSCSDKLITLYQRKLENLKLKKKALLQKLFPKNGEQYPELRFPGFTDAWEQRKLGEITDVRDGTHASPKFYNDGFPLVTSKNLKDGRIHFNGCSLISKDDYEDINKRSKVELGDILFGMIGTIGNPVIVDSTGFAIKNVALIKLNPNINNKFVYHLLSSYVFDSYIARTNVGGTQKFIALNQIRNFEFLVPSLEEQGYIANILDILSNLITLHQRKLEHLQLQKKALLQQMFV